MATFPSAGRTLQDGASLAEVITAVRQMQTAQNRNLATIQREIQAKLDEVSKAEPKFLYARRGKLYLDELARGNPGDIAYTYDGIHLVLGQPGAIAPTDPTTGPATGASHILLDGVYNTDTVNTAVARGALVVGNSTPKWGRLAIGAANTSLISNGTDPSWGSPVTGGGWADDGTTVRLITATDLVAIGSNTAVGNTALTVFNANAATNLLMVLKGAASQSGDMLRFLNSANRTQAKVDSSGSRLIIGSGSALDAAVQAGVFFGDPIAGGVIQNTKASVMFVGGNVGPFSMTADNVGVTGAKFYTYKDITGTFDFCYGQDNLEGWVGWGDDTIGYSFYLSLSGVVTPIANWAGNGDFTQYGIVNVKKNAKAAGSVAASTPALRLWSTGSSSPTKYVGISAPGTVGTSYTLTLPTAAPSTTGITRVDSSGNVTFDTTPVISSTVAAANVNLTAQAAAITSTNLVASPAVGLYRVSYAISWTTADGASTGTVQMQVGHTDDIGATTQTGTAIAATTQTRDRGSFVCYVASGALTYQTNVTGTIGVTAKYALRVRVEYLG